MSDVKIIFSNGEEIIVDQGTKLSEVMKALDIPMDFPCGGVGRCGQCKVKVANFEPKDNEIWQEVLACSYKPEQDIRVMLPEGMENKGSVILATGDKADFELNPGVQKRFVPGISLHGGSSSYWAEFHKQYAGLNKSGDGLTVLQEFSGVITPKNKGNGFTLVSSQEKIIGFEAGDTTEKIYGLAIDIGTTTVVGYLIDLNTGQEVAVGAELNGQKVYGADVISRITAASEKTETLKDLQKKVLDTINRIVETVTSKAGISFMDIYNVTIAGNTCMHHLLLGLQPAALGRAPFLPVIERETEIPAAELGILINPQARVWVFPVIAGFVGGDTVAAILASNLHRAKGIKLLVDIGTNGELAMKAHGHMAVCSAAAGPALEGAQITFGMRAEQGAIGKVTLTPEIKYEVIGGGKAKGICGSGLIDLLAELVQAGLITSSGGLVKPEKYDGPAYLKDRLVKGDHGYRFLLLKDTENDGREIFFSQDDVMQLQLAKGALRAAIELLVKKLEVEGQHVEEILLAGAFGNFLDVENAHIIGLLPEWGRGKLRSIGNAAGEGARLALLSVDKRKEAGEIPEGIEFMELAGTPDFQEAFIKGMLF